MLRFVKLFSVIALISGCSHIYGDDGMIKNRDKDYLKAQSIPPITLPAGYNSANIQDHYPVSEAPYSLSDANVQLTPPGLNTSGK